MKEKFKNTLSKRAKNALRMEIHLGNIPPLPEQNEPWHVTETELLKIENIGKKTLRNIKKCLLQNGCYLATTLDHDISAAITLLTSNNYRVNKIYFPQND